MPDMCQERSASEVINVPDRLNGGDRTVGDDSTLPYTYERWFRTGTSTQVGTRVHGRSGQVKACNRCVLVIGVQGKSRRLDADRRAAGKIR